jgi:hypothetical protein
VGRKWGGGLWEVEVPRSLSSREELGVCACVWVCSVGGVRACGYVPWGLYLLVCVCVCVCVCTYTHFSSSVTTKALEARPLHLCPYEPCSLQSRSQQCVFALNGQGKLKAESITFPSLEHSQWLRKKKYSITNAFSDLERGPIPLYCDWLRGGQVTQR